MRRALASLGLASFALALLAAGCEAYSEARRSSLRGELIELRSARTALLDELYTSYGGGPLVRSLREAAESRPPAEESEAGGTFRDFVTGLVEEGDRSLFEEQVRIVGLGDRPTTASSKARDFFSVEEVRRDCRRVVELGYQIEDTKQELAALERARGA